MIVFNYMNCIVMTPDDYMLNMKKLDTLAYLAKKLEKHIPHTDEKPVIDFILKRITVRHKDDYNNCISISFEESDEKVQFDYFIRTVIVAYDKLRAYENTDTTKGEE